MAGLSRRALLRGALQPEPDAGKAMVTGACFAARGIYCRSCAEACEPRALRIRPMLGGRAAVEIEADTCTGCGECAAVCPAAAISVNFPASEAPRD